LSDANQEQRLTFSIDFFTAPTEVSTQDTQQVAMLKSNRAGIG